MSPLIKICGLSTVETLEAALAARVDRVGLVFFARSPRNVTLAQARLLAERARGRAAIVVLTVDPDDAALRGILETVAPDMLQLHGSESVERVAAVRSMFGRPVIKAIGVRDATDLAAVPAFAAAADELLFDAKPPRSGGLPGGNGAVFDWRLLAALDLDIPFMLSGGLTPDNVGEALAITGASAVDVSSGVEIAPGIKDPARIAAFVRAARAAGSVQPDRASDPSGDHPW